MAKKAGRALSDNDMSNVAGGEVVSMNDGSYALFANGKNVFKNGKTYASADEALNALDQLNSTGFNINDSFTTENRLKKQPIDPEQNS